MKKLALAALMATLGTAAFAADPLEGIWQTEVDDGAYALVTIKPCAAAYCGKITKTYKEDGSEYGSENKGKTIVIDMVPQGESIADHLGTKYGLSAEQLALKLDSNSVNVIRLLPALTISDEDIAEALARLDKAATRAAKP